MSDSPDEASPNQPSLARFLISFVVVPGLIILLCLAALVGFRGLTFSPTTAEGLVDTIENRQGNVRWRAAVELATMLADPQDASLREDRRLATRLSDILQRELDSGGSRREDVTLRIFLCRALGEFRVDTSLTVLLEAAAPQHRVGVRRSALEAVALLTDSLGTERMAQEPAVEQTLLTASHDGDSGARLSAAYALGVLGSEEAQTRLTAMLLDDDVLVRYNAATGLARSGNRAATDVLIEMLAADQTAALSDDKDGPSRIGQTESIHLNALAAIGQLLDKTPTLSAEPFRDPLTKLKAVTDSVPVRARIEETESSIRVPLLLK